MAERPISFWWWAGGCVPLAVAYWSLSEGWKMQQDVTLPWLLLVAVTAGCGPSGPTKYPVQGEVRFDGKPLASGTMTLIPESPQARTTVAQIVDGKYAMEVTASDWTVNIQAVRETGPVNPTLGEAPREQYIPAKFNGDSQLKITVPSDQSEFNYDLEA